MTAVEERPGTRPARLVAAGRCPLEKLVTRSEFGQIQEAGDDLLAGTAIKPVLPW
ncbi:hypothetical protein [Amycolatopsis plumensis]|uniref:Uncharacterized protein n=1 Tax=Amycolatopsis plumensis TaxID=236508 RepID=A0ABV5U2Z5_9PSEU